MAFLIYWYFFIITLFFRFPSKTNYYEYKAGTYNSLCLLLVCARLRYVAGTQWGSKKYMNIKHLEVALEGASIVGWLHSCQSLQTKV